MMKTQFKKVWRVPLLLAAITVFGLVSALLGSGFWYPVAWAAMSIPLGIVVWKVQAAKK